MYACACVCACSEDGCPPGGGGGRPVGACPRGPASGGGCSGAAHRQAAARQVRSAGWQAAAGGLGTQGQGRPLPGRSCGDTAGKQYVLTNAGAAGHPCLFDLCCPRLPFYRSGQQEAYALAPADAYSSPDAAVARRRPAGSKIEVKKRGPRLEIDIPPAGFRCAGLMAAGRLPLQVDLLARHGPCCLPRW